VAAYGSFPWPPSEHLKVTLADDQPFYEWGTSTGPERSTRSCLAVGPVSDMTWFTDRTTGRARVDHGHLLPYRRREVNLICSPETARIAVNT
jgi:hypothetical protein